MGVLISRLQKFFDKQDFGLLVLRFFLGVLLILHGIHYFMQGVSTMKVLGKMAGASLPFTFKMLGIIATFNMLWAGVFIVLGFFFRFATFVVFVMSFMGALYYAPFKSLLNPPTGHLLTLALLSLALTFVGPGKYAIKK